MKKPDPSPQTADCFGCAPDNPAGLQLDIYETDQGTAFARWSPQDRFRGYNNISHGGAVASVIDEMMGWALYIAGLPPHATFKLEVEYRGPHWIGKQYDCEAWVAEQRGKAVQVAAQVRESDGGKITARGTATFVRLPAEKLAEFMQAAAAS